MREILEIIGRHLEAGEHHAVAEHTRIALAAGLTPAEILSAGLLPAMDIIGLRFRDHLIFLPDVLLAARAMHAGMAVLEPQLVGGELPTRGTVILGTVRGDVHDIGKNLVGIMLQGAGYRVVDVGHSAPPESFVDRAEEHGAAVIGLSALLTTTMPAMAEVVELVHQRGLNATVRTIVGGAPVDAGFAATIGADAYGFDASDAVQRVHELCGSTTP